MKINLSDIVSKYLFTYGSVCIPGIGTFTISDSSAGFKLENDVLTPPTKMVEFLEEMKDEDSLVKYLKNNHGQSRKEAEKKISDYSKKFLNDLLNYGVADIPGIGKLSKYASGEIVFDPAKEYLITANYMLPELKLTPIDNTGVVKDLTPQKAPKAPLAAAAIPTAATTAAFLGDKNLEAKKPQPTLSKTTTTPEVTKTAPIVESKKEIKPPQKPAPVVKKDPVVSVPKKTPPPPVVYDDEPSLFKVWFWPLVWILGLGALLFFGIKACNKYVGEDGIKISNPLADKGVVKGSTDKAVDTLEDYLKKNPNMQKYASHLTKEIVDDGCVVIVGTFKKSRNVIRMKDRLVRAGLDPYTEMHQGMTRVGVIFPCEDHDLVGYIDTLRKSIDTRAWYLSPRMDVARK